MCSCGAFTASPPLSTTVLVIMSCPVIITAWGTDYPDCAVVSYVAGAVACLAMPSRGHARRAWIALAVVLLTLATFSHGMGAVLCATTIGTYGLVRLARQRAHLLQDAVFIVAVAALTTLGLMVASRAVLGQFNLITPTLRAATYLNRPDQLVRWHSANWRWAPYVAYLLVPPSVVVSYLIVSARRWRDISTPQVYLGAVCALQLAVFSYLQFAYHVQALEMHFFSSTIWGTVCLALGVVIAEITRPLWARPLGRWLPAVLVVAVALGYEADPHVPAFGWWPAGAIVAAVPVLLLAFMRLGNRGSLARSTASAGMGAGALVAVVGVTGSLLVLTVAPRPPIPKMKGLAATVGVVSNYNEALGGSATSLLDWYQVSAALPSFVGEPAYKGEQVMMWVPGLELGDLMEPIGMFHAGFNMLPPDLPLLGGNGAAVLATRRPAELLFLSTTGTEFENGFVDLGPYRPLLVRTTVMRRGTAVLHAWLVVLQLFSRHAA